MNHKQKVSRVKKSNLIPKEVAETYEDELYKLVVDQTERELEEVKSRFDKKFDEMFNNGQLSLI